MSRRQSNAKSPGAAATPGSNYWQAFDAAAKQFHDRPAIEVQRPSHIDAWSYQQLHDRAIAVAGWLTTQGVQPGDRCAILADNDAHWCAAYLGILRIGAVAVPLDTNYSAQQVATIVQDSGARILLTDARLSTVAHDAVGGLHDVVVHALHQLPESAATTPPPSPATAADAAVILYTSGTTSDPKGVVLSHGNLMAERDAAFNVLRVSEHDSVLGVLPLFHALAQLANLLLPFAVGARVVFLETVNSTDLLRALVERKITVFACVPQLFYLIHQRITEQAASGVLRRVLWNRLLSASFALRRIGVNAGPILFRRVHHSVGPTIRLFVTGGSKFDPAVGRDLYAMGFTVLQAYGLTETSGAATLTSEHDAFVDTVGRALPGQEIKILPPESDAPDGEIAIRGPIIMQGYFNRPDATAAVMQGEWLLTGDLGRIAADGRVTITGRKKEVIVLASGKNIYPEEIEQQYQKSAFIQELCVLGRASPDEPTTERLFAVVVPDMELLRERKIVNAGDLIRFEMDGQSIHLPPHKRVLGYEIWFEPLPRTTTGQMKRHEIARRLDAQQSSALSPTPEDDASPLWPDDPRVNETLDIVARRARRTRNAVDTRVLPGDNLELNLGFDSMERVELVTELEQRFAGQLDEQQAQQILTVRQLVDAILSGASGRGVARTEPSWEVLLRNLPSASDPVLSELLVRRPFANTFAFALMRLVRPLIARVDVSGLQHVPAKGPFIICPNHQGFLDPVFICSLLPFTVIRDLFVVVAAEYFETPLTRWIARQLNLFPVDPDANLVPAMKAAAFGLAHRKVLVLFPEGERSIDGTVKRFKKGAPILAHHLRVPIVPVALHGAFEVWPRNRSINWKLIWPWSGHRLRIAFLPPQRFDETSDYGAAAEQLRSVVDLKWKELERRSNPPPL
jgi:long-chain acyl-CoA synthetase